MRGEVGSFLGLIVLFLFIVRHMGCTKSICTVLALGWMIIRVSQSM